MEKKKQIMRPGGVPNFRDEKMTVAELQYILDAVKGEIFDGSIPPDSKLVFYLRSEGEEYEGDDGDIILLVDA